MTGAGRRAALETFHPDEAATLAAEVGAEVRNLTRKGLADPADGWKHLSDARVLAQILDGLCGYVRMFERGP